MRQNSAPTHRNVNVKTKQILVALTHSPSLIANAADPEKKPHTESTEGYFGLITIFLLD